ncbi:MAG: GNAT family N-acetyltransferase [Flavobacteriales bacterium]|nr:GNAT family N-acetyltransferase [Flavobacteriales bacterium]
MDWRWHTYEDLSKDELYDAMRLRQEVFVVEQECPYLDADGRDRGNHHLLGYDDLGIAVYARVLRPGALYPEVCISRVVSAPRVRRTGAGRLLMKECLVRVQETYGPVPIRISAQAYLQAFYESFGFGCTGKEYLEDGIPHKEMLRP